MYPIDNANTNDRKTDKKRHSSLFQMQEFQCMIDKVLCCSRNRRMDDEEGVITTEYFHIVVMRLCKGGLNVHVHIKRHPRPLCPGLLLKGRLITTKTGNDRYPTRHTAECIQVEFPLTLKGIRLMLTSILPTTILESSGGVNEIIKQFGGRSGIWQRMREQEFRPLLDYESSLRNITHEQEQSQGIIRFMEEIGVSMRTASIDKIVKGGFDYEKLRIEPMSLFDTPSLNLERYTEALKTSGIINQADHEQLDLLLWLYNAEADGSTCQPFDGVLTTPTRHLVLEQGYLYRKNSFHVEQRIARLIRERRQRPARIYGNASDDMKGFHDRQIDAIMQCIQEPVSCITGGPGTGKSFLLKTLQERVWASFDEDDGCCMLLAPTGVAVCNLLKIATSTTQCSTIHSFNRRYQDIETGNGLFTYTYDEHDRKLVQQDRVRVLVIDECTMVDNKLLVDCLAHIPLDVNVVFMGDCQQLESISPGAVMRECLRSMPAVKLTHVFRQGAGSGITDALEQVLRNQRHPSSTKVGFTSTAIQSVDLRDRVVGIVRSQPNTMVIVPTNKIRQESNQLLQALLNPPSPDKTEWHFASEQYFLRVGDRVMCTKNQDRLVNGIANGSMGTLTSIHHHDSHLCAIVLFDNDYRQHFTWTDEDTVQNLAKGRFQTKTSLCTIQLAYAITVHKSQGSEWDHVLFVDIGYKQQRSQTYTALSRAKLTCHHFYTQGKNSDEFEYERLRVSTLARMVSNKRPWAYSPV